jgi:two-component sensor histidine kinase
LVDVTKVIVAEEHQRLLISELNHRVRNMLGVVIGLVTQSAAREPAVRKFTDRLLERLQALAGTYGLMSRDNWGPVGLRELVQKEVGPYVLNGEKRRVTIEGPPVLLAPKAALAFGMALHELATNATKHGSLLEPDGRVEVSWVIDGMDNGGERRLIVRWREAKGPEVSIVRHPGFGMELLSRLLSYEVDGEASIEFAPEGVTAELSAPVDGELVRFDDRLAAATGSAELA